MNLCLKLHLAIPSSKVLSSVFASRKVFALICGNSHRTMSFRFARSFQRPRPLGVKKEVRLDSEKSCLMPDFLRDLANVPGETPHVSQETPHDPQGTPHEPQAGGQVPQDLD
jgi:hypothetical protein